MNINQAIKELRELNPLLNVVKGHKWSNGYLITFRVSYKYNGGPDFILPEIVVPDQYELIGIGIGLNFNCHPPCATRLLTDKKD